MTPVKIFIVEDDQLVSSVIKQALSRNEKYDISMFETAEDCLNNLHQRPDIVVVDYNLPGMDGLSLMEKIKAYNQQTMIIICSGQESVEVVINCYRNGASDYILKDTNMVLNLENTIKNLSQNVILRNEVETLQDQIIDRNKYSYDLSKKLKRTI
jgi:two-component system, NtrC family, response regulator AtoC